MTTLDRAAVMRRDYFKLSKSKLKPDDPRVARSALLRARRGEAIERLDLTVPEELPIAEHAQTIVELLRDNQVLIVAGETGSGKTTQLPKLLLEAGLGRGALIGHTQPRRIAARTVAQRIAQECRAELGREIGFAVRFSDQTGDETLVKIMTDGLLLAELRRDRFLDGYDAIVIDEAHERSLNIDFLLGYLKRLCARRRDLKVVITSATIDVARFAEFFGGAPVVAVGGRTHPVEVRYQEQPEDTTAALIEVLEEIAKRPLGGARDVLAFFSGEREIFEAAKSLRRHFGERYEVLPLYARLSFADQQRVFATTGRVRRVVLATNVAETSLTVPNIGYVVDPGFARINRYSYRSKLERLPIEPISRASADQRKGRCGRIAPGVCYRLYSEADYLSRDEFTDPEIRRVNLASVVLQMRAFGLGDIATFPFIDPPDGRAVKDALRLLDELQAIKGSKLTAAGKQMARIPVDPRLARMLVAANGKGCLTEALVIVAALAIQDPRERPIEKAQAADSAQAEFRHAKSDFLSFIKLWDWIEEERQSRTRSSWQRELRKRFLSVQRVREWREIHRQLKLVCRELGFRENSRKADFRSVHEALIVGSLSLVAQHDERGQYVGARNLKLRIFPGSGLAKQSPKWLVAAEIVETSRVYARCVAGVEPGWIEAQAQHLVKRQYSAPFWSSKRGEPLANESVSLYGLRLAERRPVAYADIDPDLSRDLFLREGLVRGAVADPPEFLERNLREIARVHDLEAKGRRRDLLASDDDFYQFYAKRIPAEICRVADLRAWLRRCAPDEEAALHLSDADILQRTHVDVRDADFPNELDLDGVALALKYRFAPGEADDGVSLLVPSSLLHAVGQEPLEWSVPGMLPALVEHWLRSLPKSKRRALAPISDKVPELTERLGRKDQYRKGRLLAALARLLNDLYRLDVAVGDWDRGRVPEHLLVNVKVRDASGKLLGQGRDLGALKAKLLDGSPAAARASVAAIEEEGITRFPAKRVPAQMLLEAGGTPLMVYPGFVDRGDVVDVQGFTSVRERDAANRRGLPRLALLQLGKVGLYFKKELKSALRGERALGLHFASLGSADELQDEVLRNVVWYCFFEGADTPQTANAFDQLLQDKRGDLAEVYSATLAAFTEALRLRFSIVRSVDALESPAYAASVDDVRRLLDWLVPADLLARTPFAYLPLLPRYLAGIETRIANLPGRVPKDRALMSELAPLEARHRALADAELYDEARYTELKFLIEELRLKLFTGPGKLKAADHPLGARAAKVSVAKVGAALREEELRVGLA